MVRTNILDGTNALGILLPTQAVGQLETLVSELQRWGKRINLTSILKTDEIVTSHILDSIAIKPLCVGPRVIDIGTGAGFPGLPLAIIDPETEFTLLDSHGKKLSFVKHMVALLGLSNVTPIIARAEDYAPGERFDTVIARAVATVPRLIELSAHLLKEDGQLLALKGKHPAAELETISASPEWVCRISEITVPGLESHMRHVVRVQKS